MSVFRFIRRIAEGESIVVFGDGSQSRDFTFVDDIARGTIAALRRWDTKSSTSAATAKCGCKAVIDEIARLIGKKPEIEYRPAHPADVPRHAGRRVEGRPAARLAAGGRH